MPPKRVRRSREDWRAAVRPGCRRLQLRGDANEQVLPAVGGEELHADRQAVGRVVRGRLIAGGPRMFRARLALFNEVGKDLAAYRCRLSPPPTLGRIARGPRVGVTVMLPVTTGDESIVGDPNGWHRPP